MKIGTVAEQLGIPASTIRYYEKIGLIQQQHRVSGRCEFNDQTLLILQFVQLAQAAGFTIAETKALLESYTQDPSPAGMWKPFAEAKRANIRQQIKDLKQMDGILTAILKCECSTLSECVQSSVAKPCLKSNQNDDTTH